MITQQKGYKQRFIRCRRPRPRRCRRCRQRRLRPQAQVPLSIPELVGRRGGNLGHPRVHLASPPRQGSVKGVIERLALFVWFFAITYAPSYYIGLAVAHVVILIGLVL